MAKPDYTVDILRVKVTFPEGTELTRTPVRDTTQCAHCGHTPIEHHKDPERPWISVICDGTRRDGDRCYCSLFVSATVAHDVHRLSAPWTVVVDLDDFAVAMLALSAATNKSQKAKAGPVSVNLRQNPPARTVTTREPARTVRDALQALAVAGKAERDEEAKG